MQNVVPGPGGRLDAEHYAALYDESLKKEQALAHAYEATAQAYERTRRAFLAIAPLLEGAPADVAALGDSFESNLVQLADMALEQQDRLAQQQAITQRYAVSYLAER